MVKKRRKKKIITRNWFYHSPYPYCKLFPLNYRICPLPLPFIFYPYLSFPSFFPPQSSFTRNAEYVHCKKLLALLHPLMSRPWKLAQFILH